MNSLSDEERLSLRGKINASRRRSIGIFWKVHNPKVSFCRCLRCMKKRHPRAGDLEKLAADWESGKYKGKGRKPSEPSGDIRQR